MNVKRMVMVVGILVATMAVGVGRSYATLPDGCEYTQTCGECTWFIEKWADKPTASEPTITLAIGQQLEVNYRVYVIGTGAGCPAVDVYDTFFMDPLERGLTAAETLKKYEYTRTIGPYETCGEYTVTNTASLSSIEPQLGPVVLTTTPPPCEFDLCYSWTIPVHVPCEGCTLTQGYWKTHSGNRLKGGPPYDETWDQILPSGSNSPFYLSGVSYYNVLKEPPKGNVYYILARQFIAAKLNILNGASSTSEVDGALAASETFFNTYTPGAAANLGRALRNAALINANILDGYNNGYVGPGHCSEEAE